MLETARRGQEAGRRDGRGHSLASEPMPLALLLVLFIAVPLAELYLILKVGDAIGAVWTVLLLALDSILGSILLRSQGRAAWRRFTAALGRGGIPHQEVLDGVLIVLGGAFLLTPGLLTDAVGLLFLIPPTRAVARRLIVRVLRRRFAIGVAGGVAGAAERARASRRRAPHYDVEGTASDAAEPDGRSSTAGAPRLEP